MSSRRGRSLAVPLVLLSMASLMIGRIVTYSLLPSVDRATEDDWMWEPMPERASDGAGNTTNPRAAAQRAANNTTDLELQYLVVGHPYQVNQTDHPATVTLNQAFSASWWTSKENFLKYELVEINSASPEGASFELFLAHDGRVRMTFDWLDFAVEHMSKWWKILRSKDGVDTVVDIFKQYVHNREPFAEVKDNPAESTIAVIAYMPFDREDLTTWSLAATISSLLTYGFGRVVVSGRSTGEEAGGVALIMKAFEIIGKLFPGSHTKLAFCPCYDEPTGDQSTGYNIPKSSLRKLRHAFLKKLNGTETKRWLGDNENVWKYVYLTEPDILLVTRPASLDAFGKMLDDGYVLAPHRIQPIPHGSDFDMPMANDTRFVIPAEGRFRHVYRLNSSTMSCCDEPKSGGTDPFWYMKGFNQIQANASTPLEVAHEKILGIPLIRLVDHSTVVFCGSEHRRMCHPQPFIGCRNNSQTRN